MTHYNIPLTMRSPYKNTEVAIAHHKIVQDLQGLRQACEGTADELRNLDITPEIPLEATVQHLRPPTHTWGQVP